jgi:hypothetical protein
MPSWKGIAMAFLKDATDAELAERYARVDLRLRGMLNWSPEMDKFDSLLSEIREEMDRRRKENGDGK